MDSDNVTNPLADGQVLELFREEDHGNRVNHASILIDLARLICNLQRANELIRLERFVGEAGI